jgi:hypothetical protein
MFIIPAVCLFALALILVVVFFLKKFKIRKVLNKIEEISISFQGESAKPHFELVEEVDDKKSASLSQLNKD